MDRIPTDMENLKKYIHHSRWKKLLFGGDEFHNVTAHFKGIAKDGNYVYSHLFARAIVTSKEAKYAKIDINELKKHTINNAKQTLLDWIEKTVGNSFLLLPCMMSYKSEETGEWVITPEQAELKNKPYKLLAEKEDEEGFWIPATDIEGKNALTEKWERLKDDRPNRI